MASITVGNLDPDLFELLHISAGRNGRSMEEEARFILTQAFNQNDCARGLGTRINNRFRTEGGVELDLPTR
jgi:plasmid stability protein